MTKREIYDHRALALVPADASLEVLATGCTWS